MAVYTIQDTTLTDIADAIRGKTGKVLEVEYSMTNNVADNISFNIVKDSSYRLTIIPTELQNDGYGKLEITWVDKYSGTTYVGNFGSVATRYVVGEPTELIFTSSVDGTITKIVNIKAVSDSRIVSATLKLAEVNENGTLKNKYKPTEMANTISEMLIIPEEAFSLSGDCSYKFAYEGSNWLINAVGDKMITKNIYGTNMFYFNASIEEIPFALNIKKGADANSYFQGCSALTISPEITGCAGGSKMFQECKKLLSLNNTKLSYTTSSSSIAVDDMFRSCYSLRDIGNFFDDFPSVFPGKSIYGLYRTFENCYSIDELNLPFIYSTYGATYSFGGCFSYCFRLKELTFRGGAITAGHKGCVIDLTDYVGYQTGSTNYLAKYGFTDDTRVVDDETYQALKDHPDYWTSLMAYSRYNHNSAVNTLNSLPDCSSLSASNTIKFKGEAGSATDGGAINTLTEEEIAVATAKGWTVSLA